MCIGIDHCSKKNCLEQERCLFQEITSLKIKIYGPDILGKVDISKAKCKKQIKVCSNERACEILGQCILDHPLVKANKKATKALKHRMPIQQVVDIISKLMPSLNKSGFKKQKTNR